MDIETRNGSLRILQVIGILFALIIFAAHAEEGFYLEKLIKRYATLEAYCDKGTITEQRIPSEKSKPTERNKFERCYRSDGFYKKIDFYDNYQKTRKIYWADGDKTYYANSYTKNGSLKTSIFFDRPVRPRKQNAEYDLPDHVLGQLLIEVLNGSRDYLGRVKSYDENKELSNNEYTVVEYKRKIGDDPTIDTYRIWISNKDYVVTKAERLLGSVRLLLIEITDYQINPALTKEDLWHEPPLLMWYSLHRRPDVFIPVLLSSSYFVGFLFWSIVFSRGRRIKDGSILWPNKVRMWKTYSKFVLISAGAFLVLFLLISLGGGGYLWAILFAGGYGAIYGLGTIAIGCFLLSAHLAYWVAKMRISKAIS